MESSVVYVEQPVESSEVSASYGGSSSITVGSVATASVTLGWSQNIGE